MAETAEAISASAISLAELAQLDTSDVATLTSRLPPVGLYVVKGTKVGIVEQESQDPAKPNLFRVGFEYEVLTCELSREDIDPDNYIGKPMRESYTLWPNDFTQGIGLLKGRYKMAGLPNAGKLGGVEGQPPGWLDGMVNQIFCVRVRHFTSQSGNERAGYDWLEYKQEGDEVAEEAQAAAG